MLETVSPQPYGVQHGDRRKYILFVSFRTDLAQLPGNVSNLRRASFLMSLASVEVEVHSRSGIRIGLGLRKRVLDTLP